MKAAPAQPPPFFLQAQLSPFFRQLFSRGCAGAGRRSHRSFCSCFFRGCAGAALYQFLGSCFSEAARAQRSPIFRQLFSRGCADTFGAPWRTRVCSGWILLEFWVLSATPWGALGRPFSDLTRPGAQKDDKKLRKSGFQMHNGCKNGFRTTAALTRSVYLQ